LLNNSGDIGLVTDADLISLEGSKVTINGSLTTTGAITAPSSINTINGIVVNSGSITSGVWQGTPVAVPFGGTGSTSFTDHGLIIGSGIGALSSLTPGTDGQVLLGISGDDPVFRSLGGDISSISVSGTGPATVALATTGVIAGSYGTSTLIPQITVDSKVD